ncbi:MAG: Asp-tRNA(Asn)/Glu-tRNA(Gln) amidotransferase subunit GatB, partial [Ureaplasma sp.]|nr:Asp-tRNA(Asn)/Glu-tRNA(Gln) amidotransferase subunit GatB [Ureaplasma sp.]
MINNFEIIIGIETHVVLNTKTKMFSSSINSHHLAPNTAINEIDLGLPGILPTPNPNAIKKAIWLGLALNSEINWQRIQFDRKNYYYLDLPKGFQITQQYYPIGRNGELIINIDEQKIPIEIERFHLEEDTAKQIISDNTILLDYNRSGCPLIEIVTKPVIRSSQQAAEYLRKLIQILKFNNISDSKLEDGSMRADINISIRPIGQKEFNKKVEIKNVNSINNVVKAIEYEVDRQTKILLKNELVNQETRRFDEATNTTIFMREKTDAINYFYFNDINIPIISLTKDEFEKIKSEKNKDLDVIISELNELGFNKNNINLLINNYDMYQ